jgi:hypothetical protein
VCNWLTVNYIGRMDLGYHLLRCWFISLPYQAVSLSGVNTNIRLLIAKDRKFDQA